MSGELRRAVTAGIDADGLRRLEPLLARRGFRLAGLATDAAGGLRLIEALQPALVIAAAIMPGMDGVAFAARVRDMRLNTQPPLLLLKPRGLRLPGGERLAGLGARTADMPLDAAGLEEALTAFAEGVPVLPPARAGRLSALLDALGVPEHPGRSCLTLAVALVWQDRGRLDNMKRALYPALCRHTGLTPAQAERAMRHVIDAAWRTGQIEHQHRIFGDTIDARRGQPTCGEMIARLAEELRWEG